MKTIFKYPIGQQTALMLPKGAEIVHVNSQLGRLYLWCLVETNETQTDERIFRTFGTGHDIPQNLNLKYIGTSKVMDEVLIWHTFEVMR